MPSPSPDSLPLVVVKLGGSLITHKHRDEAFCRMRTRRLARELAQSGRQTVVVHGTGSFGKPPAIRHGYDDGGLLGGEQAAVVAEVASRLHVLRGLVLACLAAEGLKPFGLAAASLLQTQQGRICRCRLGDVRTLLARGMTPVISGDLVLDDSGGFAVCSSDAIAAYLAPHLGAERLIFATDSPVLLPSADGKRWAASELHADDPRIAGNIHPTVGDVSGGMSVKLSAGFEAVRAGVDTWVVDGRVPGRVGAAVHGLPVLATRLWDEAGP